jgi:hypothetical protein
MNIRKEILKVLAYDREPMQPRLSASMINDNLYHKLMTIGYGSIEGNVSQATIGSIFHKGIEVVLKDADITNELELEPIQFGRWTITGTADLVDTINKVIYDVKLVKYSKYAGGKSFKGLKDKDAEDEDYFIQLNIYRYLLEQMFNVPFDMKLLLFFKDGGWDYRQKQPIPSFAEMEVPKIPDFKISNLINNTIEELEEYIEFNEDGSIEEIKLDEVGEMHKKECREKYGFITTKSGDKKPGRCSLYCDFKNVCKAYNSHNDEHLMSW